MDEQLGIAIWLMMAILSINFALIWLDANSTVFHTGISQNTMFNDIQSKVNATSGDTSFASGNPIVNAIKWLLDLANSFNIIITTVLTLYLGWVWVLGFILGSWGSIGLLIYLVIIPIPLMVQASATALLVWKVAVAIRGVIPL